MTNSERTYYIVFALYNLSWAFLGAVYPLFLMSRGLDLFQINVILAVYLFSNFAFEVPTGAIADVFGRKVSFLMSCSVRASAFALYFSVDTFAGFVVAEIVDALGTTLASGALDAWAIDGMREDGDCESADRLFSRGKMVSHAAMIASGLAGAYIADIDLGYPWLVGFFGFMVTFTVAAVMMRPDQPARRDRNDSVPERRLVARLNPLPTIQSQVSRGLSSVLRHPTLRFICVVTALLSFAQMPFQQVWPARMTALSGQGRWLMGWIWALLNLAALCGSWSLPVLVKRAGRRHSAIVLSAWRTVFVALAASAGGFGRAAVGLISQSAAVGASDPLLGAWMNEHASRHERATVLSIQAMSFMFGGSAGLVCLGVIARSHGIPTAWAGSALVLFFAVVLIWRSDTNGGDAASLEVPIVE